MGYPGASRTRPPGQPAARSRFGNASRRGGPAHMDDVDTVRRRLEALKQEHRDLDDVIARITEDGGFDQLQVQRLKKRKLVLKDQITKLESELHPDIIA